MQRNIVLVLLALIALCAGMQVAVASMGTPVAPRRLPEGDYDIWENGVDTGKDLNSSSNGENVMTEGPPAWFGQWDAAQGRYDQHPGNQRLEIFDTGTPGTFSFTLEDGSGAILLTGTLKEI